MRGRGEVPSASMHAFPMSQTERRNLSRKQHVLGFAASISCKLIGVSSLTPPDLARRWAEPMSAAGLSGNHPMDSNLSPPGNNPFWQKIECAVSGHA